MIESIMYFGIGFLFATLIGVAVIPLVHNRAVRLTIRRLEDSIPQSMTEIQADKDALRAEFAMSTRHLEMSVEQLKNKAANQLAELSQKGAAINRLKIEREAQKVEVTALKIEVEALEERLTAAGKEVEAAEGRHHEGGVSLVPRAWPTTELVKVPTDSLQGPPLTDQRHKGELISFAPKEWPKAEEARSGRTVGDPLAGLDSSDQRIGMAREGSDFSAGLKVLEPSIQVSPRASGYQLVSNRPSIGKRISRSSARFVIAALIGVGATFAWQSRGDEAKEMVRTWAASFGWMSSVSTTKLSPDIAAKQAGSIPASQESTQDAAPAQSAPVTQRPSPAATATSPELVKQLEEAMEHDLAGMGHSVEQLPAKQEQTAQTVATLQAVEHDGQKMSFPALQTPEKLTPTPETRPTAIANWMLREVIDGTAVLQGPNGIWRVTRGDTVPGLGRVNAIVRWGNRWIVATSRGYCKSAPPNHAVQDGTCQLYGAN
ncbi:MAG: hypothetical protein WCD13_10485 [Pseudolabrys sp.]